MALLVAIVAILMAGLGMFGVLSPDGLAEFTGRWRSARGLWTASILRVIFGVALWHVAPVSRAPFALQFLAVVAMGAGVLLPILGLARFESMLDWWIARPPSFQQGWAAFAAALGLALLWATA